MALQPEQITDIIRTYFGNFEHAKYTGMRYIPIFGRKGEDTIEWDNDAPYEPLTVVISENGDSYISRCFVPAGIELDDGDYWAKTYDYDAQMESIASDASDALESAADAATVAGAASDAADAATAAANAAALAVNNFHQVCVAVLTRADNTQFADGNDVDGTDWKLATNFQNYTLTNHNFPNNTDVRDSDGYVYLQPGCNLLFFESTLVVNANFNNVADRIMSFRFVYTTANDTDQGMQRRFYNTIVKDTHGTNTGIGFMNCIFIPGSDPVKLRLEHNLKGVDGAQNKPNLRYSELTIVHIG